MEKVIKQGIFIRRVEETFLELFSLGKLNGTVHTCVGEEMSAIAFAGQITKNDFIFSNHRCHGHFLTYTGNAYGLIAELMGKADGVCGGIGSSQHLCNNNFFSNGIQGGIVPVAAGFALANKIKKNNQIGIVFIGDGTLGEGIVYETLNILSLWSIPLLVVCEDNKYAQSTPQNTNLSGDIIKRAQSFDIATFTSDTWNVEKLIEDAKDSIDYVRRKRKPAFHLINTYRLNAHSKGEDFRDEKEKRKFYEIDPINVFKKNNIQLYTQYVDEANSMINIILEKLDDKKELELSKYTNYNKLEESINWKKAPSINKRIVNLINEFFVEYMEIDNRILFIGEDVISPYGGAFKVAKNLSELFPEQVFSTPISEAAITGIGNGLALAGYRPFVEIMFGDFITLALDQLINHTSKFYHMYNKQRNCPIVIRVPMGGRRGYGPTHSQTLDKFIVGIDNITVVALNSVVNPKIIYKSLYHNEKHPVIVIENKIDYGKKINALSLDNYIVEVSNNNYPFIRVRPEHFEKEITIVTYGGMAEITLNSLDELFIELEIFAEVIIMTKIFPFEDHVIGYILNSLYKTNKLIFIEEGKAFTGIGSELISVIAEKSINQNKYKRISSLPYPIPSVKSLENEILPSKKRIINEIKEFIS